MEAIFEKYVDDVRALIPLHRIVIFLIFLLASVISHDVIFRPMTVELFALPVSSESLKRLIGSAIFGDFVLAGFLTVVSWVIHRVFAKILVAQVWKRLGVEERIAAENDSFERLDLEPELRKLALDFANSEAKRRSPASKASSMLAEIFFGVGLCLVVYGLYGGGIDALLGFFSILMGVFFQLRSFLHYLRNVMPFELSAAALTGFGKRFSRPD